MPHISIVIPVYKAEKTLHELYRSLKENIEAITNDFEIILVEDCGGDRSWEIIQELARMDDRVKGIQFSRNFGQHAATLCGIERASGDWIITMDDDLEQNPADIMTLYNKANEGYDLVYGVYGQRTHFRWRNVTSSIIRRVFKLAISNLNYEYTSFRIIRGKIARSLSSFNAPSPFIDGYLSWLTNNYATVEVEHGSTMVGGSTYTVRKLMAHTINIFLTFSILPLKLAVWLGLGTFTVGLVWFIYIVAMKILGGISVSGYASLMAGIILFGGLQMLVLGILGEYLGFVNFKTSRKPLYLISQTTSFIEQK